MAEEKEYLNERLLKASDKGNKGLVKDLLAKGADVHARDYDGTTVLHKAARHGKEGVVRLLLKKGANIHAKDNYGNTALHKAASNGKEGVVRLLLEHASKQGKLKKLLDAKNKDSKRAVDVAYGKAEPMIKTKMEELGLLKKETR